MTDTPSLEDRLVAWLAYLGSEKAETTPIASVVCPTGESLADDLRAALATLQPSGERREAIARMRRSLDQWSGCSPEAISKGSEAQMSYFVADAKHDIALLASGLVQDEAG